jgi:hypothetical protein
MRMMTMKWTAMTTKSRQSLAGGTTSDTRYNQAKLHKSQELSTRTFIPVLMCDLKVNLLGFFDTDFPCSVWNANSFFCTENVYLSLIKIKFILSVE